MSAIPDDMMALLVEASKKMDEQEIPGDRWVYWDEMWHQLVGGEVVRSITPDQMRAEAGND